MHGAAVEFFVMQLQRLPMQGGAFDHRNAVLEELARRRQDLAGGDAEQGGIDPAEFTGVGDHRYLGKWGGEVLAETFAPPHNSGESELFIGEDGGRAGLPHFTESDHRHL
jgi:hypothetical protein